MLENVTQTNETTLKKMESSFTPTKYEDNLHRRRKKDVYILMNIFLHSKLSNK